MKFSNKIRKSFWPTSVLLLMVTITHGAIAAIPAQAPLFLQQPVRPIMMLNMSNDHQLYFKAYDDHSDLTGDGVPNTTYTHGYNYYGYFDSAKCYTYSSGRFAPSRLANDNGYCNYTDGSGEWSGNFLNWATMTRIDAVRKILYGGLRAVDTNTETVLERSFLPQDAHSFAKYYAGSDLSQLTPYTGNLSAQSVMARGITMCNTTNPSNRQQYSQNVTDPPRMLVAEGNYSLWASNERWQCRWGNYSNDNDPALSGIQAYSRSPANSTNGNYGHKLGEFNVRVEVCVPGLLEEDCRYYPEGNAKPSGLLQEYGEKGELHFGLMTGSYGRNKSGGVLRKNIGDLADEINVATDGTFKAAPTTGGIIKALDLLRVYGYDFNEGFYNNSGNNGDNCPWALTSFTDGRCTNWGNPQSEIYLESLRYLAGKSETRGFVSGTEADYISGLNTATWVDPVSEANYCAPLNVIQFNASTSSYDSDMSAASGLGIESVSTWTDLVGAGEGIHGNSYFVGSSGANNDQLCTPKAIANLSNVHGTCPDAPRLEGTYQIAGLAHYARNNSIRTDLSGEQTVRTYGVALSPAIPRVVVPVPGSAEQNITILPACRNNFQATRTNCAIVDFKIVEQEFNVSINGTTTNTGKLYVNWEDSEQGGDFDQDMWGVISYEVTATEVSVTTQVIAQSTGDPMGFGYVIGGTTTDGFHVHSGVNGFTYTSTYSQFPGCGTTTGTHCTCRVGNGFGGTAGPCNHGHPNAAARTQVYTVGTSDTQLLEAPLYYAAKWGGYTDDQATISDIAESEPETYFYATDPRELEVALRSAFSRVAATVGSAASVATESTNLTEGGFVFQARFDSTTWTGDIRAFKIEDGSIDMEEFVTTDNTMLTASGGPPRQIYTLGANGDITPFLWDNLSGAQREALNAGDTNGQNRLNWLRGDNRNEGASGSLRDRNGKLLGDIVNSSPAYLGGRDRGYRQLGGDAGRQYASYLEVKRAQPATLFVGANDGMLHAFDVENHMLTELFAYVPDGVYSKLAALTERNYGRVDNPHQYTVDGPLAVGDAYINDAWRSVVVGTLGGGGKGVFALDVTDRNNPQVLFEINADNESALGYVLGKPMIAQMANGRWAAVFGNGYDSRDGTSQLYIVDLEDPAGRTEIINTGAGTGLSAVGLLGNSYGQVQYAYAGDLEGNLWKFDLSRSNTNQWRLALDDEPLFVARDNEGNVQPITGAPTVGRNRNKNNVVMVYFGTGKYFEAGDNNANPRPQHSMYALADLNRAYTGDRDDFLNQRHITDTGTSREVGTDENLNWVDHDGWYIDFNTRNGERVIAKPLLQFDRLIFPTVIPSDVPCQFGGQSWLMDVPATGDRFSNNDSLLLDGNLSTDALIFGDPTTAIVDPKTGKLLYSSSDGTLGEEELRIPAGALGRQSWRQLR